MITLKKECAYCSTPFETKSSRKIYCSNTCRTYASLENTGQMPEERRIANRISGLSINRASSALKLDTVFNQLSSFFTDGQLYVEYYETHVTVNEKTGEEKEHRLPKTANYNAGYEDSIGLQNVIRFEKDRYLVQSTYEGMVTQLKELYNGSNIFLSASPIIDDGASITKCKVYNTIIQRSCGT